MSRTSIALVGMMGSGKSTVGTLLAERLGWAFYDTDLILEAAFRKPVAKILREGREGSFRASEELLVRMLMSLQEAVVATGGGLWLSEASRRRLGTFAYTAWLSVPHAVLWKRLERQGLEARPLLEGEDPRTILRRTLSEREPVYALADWRIEAAENDPSAVVRQLVRRLRGEGLIARPDVAA
ncbi:MAG: shikimate kinase [Gemmatimonadetes bacterium]|nr:shikimate kinase [Gemmatimonadota bacterium]